MVCSRDILQWTEPFSHLSFETIFHAYITEAQLSNVQATTQKGQETFHKALTSLAEVALNAGLAPGFLRHCISTPSQRSGYVKPLRCHGIDTGFRARGI